MEYFVQIVLLLLLPSKVLVILREYNRNILAIVNLSPRGTQIIIIVVFS